MHLTHNENIKSLEDAMRLLEIEEDRLMTSKTSDDVYMDNSTSHSGNFMVLTSKRVKQMPMQRKNKSSTNLEKERRKASSRKRSIYPSSSAITVVRRGILHMTVKSLGW